MQNNIALRPQKVLLAIPPTGLYIREDRCQTPIDKMKTIAPRPPIDMLYIAAILRRSGVYCEVRDYPVEELTEEDLIQDMHTLQPDWVIMSITTPGLKEDLRLISSLKKRFPRTLFIIKGAHFNAYDLDIQTLEECPELFAVIRGEYEDTFQQWMNADSLEGVRGLTYNWEDKIIRNSGKGMVENLDTLPFPARDLINNSLYRRPDTGEPQTMIVTSRGCPYKCTFCLSQLVSGTKVRLRSPRNIVDEIIECRDVYKIRNFLFRSDTFTVNRKWLRELCRLIRQECPDIAWVCNSRVDLFTEDIAHLIKEAGCWLVAFGVESGDQEVLESVGKDATLEQASDALKICEKTGLMSSIYILLGLPGETPQSFKKTMKMLWKLDPDFVEFFYVYPFPGSKIYEEVVAEGLMRDKEFPRTAYEGPAFATRHFTVEELNKQRFYLWMNFYLRPSYLWKVIRYNITSPRVLGRYFLRGMAQMIAFLRKETK